MQREELKRLALSGLDYEIARLTALRDSLSPEGAKPAPRSIFSAEGPQEAAERPRRMMSASARKRIGEAQRKRWAALKKPAR